MNAPLGAVEVVVDPLMPLTRTEKGEDGAEHVVQVAFWRIDGRIHVHPQRWAEISKEVAK